MSFNKWKDEYGLEFEPNYSKETELDCKAAFKAGQQSKQAEIDLLQKRIEDALETLLKSYKAQSGLPIQDEFNRGWVSAFTCVHNDLKNLIK